MQKFVTTTTIRSLFKKGEKIPQDTLIELDPANPAHNRLISGGDVIPYVKPEEPKPYVPETKTNGTPKNYNQMNKDGLLQYAKELEIALTGEETVPALKELIAAQLAE